MLKINNVCKTFGNMSILDDISFNIEKNTIVGLAGGSGSGKSTLLRCLQKLETIDSGHIEIAGKSAFMFQDFQLFPHMTILQNLIYAPKLRDKTGSHIEKAISILTDLNVAHKSDQYPHNLSGGQKQRVALARSLMIHPDLLLCDEPTSGLDVATIADVISLLQSVMRMDVTMIIASHDLDFLTKIASRILVLQKGRIVADVDPSLLEDPITYLKQYY